MSLKVAFATCVQLGVSCIETIFEIGGEIDLLITLHDHLHSKKSGRIFLDQIFWNKELDILKVHDINEKNVIQELKKRQIDWLFVIGWSQICRKELLSTPSKGCIGMHPSLLPIGRGRAAIPWAILKKLKKTGVTLFRLDEGVDSGDIIGQLSVPLNNETNATILYSKINLLHSELIKKHWYAFINNSLQFEKQDDRLATYWPGRKPEDGQIFNWMTIETASTLVRAVTVPYPGAFYQIPNDKTIRIWSCKTSTVSSGSPFEIGLNDGYLIPINYEIENSIKN